MWDLLWSKSGNTELSVTRLPLWEVPYVRSFLSIKIRITVLQQLYPSFTSPARCILYINLWTARECTLVCTSDLIDIVKALHFVSLRRFWHFLICSAVNQSGNRTAFANWKLEQQQQSLERVKIFVLKLETFISSCDTWLYTMIICLPTTGKRHMQGEADNALQTITLGCWRDLSIACIWESDTRYFRGR